MIEVWSKVGISEEEEMVLEVFRKYPSISFNCMTARKQLERDFEVDGLKANKVDHILRALTQKGILKRESASRGYFYSLKRNEKDIELVLKKN